MDEMKHQIVAFLEQICNDFRLSPMSDKELAERFNLLNNTRYDVDLLAAQFRSTRILILKNPSTSIFFKIGLLFVSQEVLSTVFEQSLSLQNICIYKLDMERKLISFYPKKSASGRGFEREGSGYANRNFTCPINRLPWNIYETTKLFNFIQSRTRGTPFHVKLDDLMKTYKEKEASRRTVEQLVAKATQYLTRDIDTVKWMTLGVKAQIIYTLQIPLSPVFLNDLYRNARFQTKDGKLSYFRMGNLTVGRENDELITRVPKKMYHVFLEHMAKKPGLMRLDDLAAEFVSEFEYFATKDEAVATILKMLDARFNKLALDPITRTCIFFKTQIHIPIDFDLKKLELGELEVDEENKIKSFVSNDGTISLNIENEVPLENNQGRKRTLAVALGEDSADTPASKKPATHSPMSNGSADDQFEDDYDEEVDPCAADLPGTSFEISSQCQNLLQQIETTIQSNQSDFGFVEPKEEKGVKAYRDSSNSPGTSAPLSTTCQNLLEQINASIEDQVQVTGPEVPDYTFIMPKQENTGTSYDRNRSNMNRNASMPVRNAPSAPSAPTTTSFVNNEPEYDESELVPLIDVKQEEEDESDDEIPTYDLNPAADLRGNLPPPQKARPMIHQTRVSQVVSSRPLIQASNRRPMYHPSQSQAASYKEILQWLQNALKTLSAGDFNDLLWNIEIEINNKKKSYKTVPIKYLALQFREAYRYITVCLNTDPKADNMIPVSEVFLLFRYEFNVLGFEELNDLNNDIMSFMRTPSRYNSMISVNELRSIMGGLFNKLECTTN